ncbi:FAD-dependent oxidoreductase [Brevibacterium marinum]|uniref:Isorenieratene synthase n=1 Tax=Brevibacterium marinum TaxID=418643 RepID=A0A846RRJ3_9MICO|nr:FAD-dependent oxidoreductase [Brevibacterium marinum]NJC56379.1 isorenieratene synthase [Brevibacterium marinum]
MRPRPRDRFAETIPAPRGRPRPLRPKRVTIVGAGIAGLSAATILAEHGIEVTVIERNDYLGGRVGAWPVEGERTMSRGFHAFFRQYYNLRDLLSRADPELRCLRPVDDYPLTHRRGATDTFASIPRTPPFNLLGFVWQSPTFPLHRLLDVDIAAAVELIDVEFPASYRRYDGESAADFLDRLRFPEEARHLALEVFARSFFADPAEFSAGELIAMFHTYFTGSAEGLIFDVPVDDYDTALWEPLGRYLSDLGVTIRTGTTVTSIDADHHGWAVSTTGDDVRSDAVVVAADPAEARALMGASRDSLVRAAPAAEQWVETLETQTNAPPFAVLRLWFDAPVADHRPAFLGTSGYDLLDNVSVLERFEAGARHWAQTHNGSVVELHAYALDIDAHPSPHARERIIARLLSDLHEVYPETVGLLTVDHELLIEADCGLTDTRPWCDRPEPATPIPGLVIAGDHVRCDTPVALMERAATTGYLAANHLLSSWRVEGTDIWSPPTRGMLRRGVLGRMRGRR